MGWAWFNALPAALQQVLTGAAAMMASGWAVLGDASAGAWATSGVMVFLVSMMVVAAVDGRIGPGALLRSWAVVYAGNFLGAAGLAGAFWLEKVLQGEWQRLPAEGA